MKIKLESVTGEQLDWLVAQCEGHKVYMRHQFMRERYEYLKEQGLLSQYADLAFYLEHADNDPIIGNVATGATKYLPRYTLDWSLAGPILSREHISRTIDHSGLWIAYWTDGYNDSKGQGKFMHCDRSELVAGLRSYVASLLGEEVEVPDELA